MLINLKNVNFLEVHENENLINELSKIHFDNLSKSFYTITGIKTVKLFYRLLLLNKNLNLIIAQEENSNIKGFVIWGPTSFSLIKTLLKNILKINYAKYISINYLFKIEILKKILNKIFATSSQYEPKLNSAQIISIVVDRNSQGKGIGSDLIKFVLKDCKTKEYSYLQASTTSYQKDALCFYKSLKNFNLVFEKKISNDYTNYVFSKNLK